MRGGFLGARGVRTALQAPRGALKRSYGHCDAVESDQTAVIEARAPMQARKIKSVTRKRFWAANDAPHSAPRAHPTTKHVVRAQSSAHGDSVGPVDRARHSDTLPTTNFAACAPPTCARASTNWKQRSRATSRRRAGRRRCARLGFERAACGAPHRRAASPAGSPKPRRWAAPCRPAGRRPLEALRPLSNGPASPPADVI